MQASSGTQREGAPIDERARAAIADIRALAEAEPSIVFVYLFGSVARGDSRAGSDVDVGVYVDPPPDLLEESRLQTRAEQALGRSVDLVVMNRAPLWLQFRIVGEGIVAYSRDEARRIRHREWVESRFLDFRPLHDQYLTAVRQHAREAFRGS